jgi:hypothetical protein
MIGKTTDIRTKKQVKQITVQGPSKHEAKLEQLTKYTHIKIVNGAFHLLEVQGTEKKGEILLATDLNPVTQSKAYIVVKIKDLYEAMFDTNLNHHYHLYEILNKEKSVPYFDIDKFPENKVYSVSALKNYIAHFLEKAYSTQIEKANILIYSSTDIDNPSKISFHAIVPGYEVNRKDLEAKIDQYDKLHLFDNRVYKSNQLFRILNSTKMGKHNLKKYMGKEQIDPKYHLITQSTKGYFKLV